MSSSDRLSTGLWNAAEHLSTAVDVAAYLDAALKDGDPELIQAVLEDIARSSPARA